MAMSGGFDELHKQNKNVNRIQYLIDLISYRTSFQSVGSIKALNLPLPYLCCQMSRYGIATYMCLLIMLQHIKTRPDSVSSSVLSKLLKKCSELSPQLLHIKIKLATLKLSLGGSRK